MSVRYTHNQKIILASDSQDSLTDAIADMLLLCGGDNERFEEQITLAKGSAEYHYNAEKDGESEGFTVLVDPQDGTVNLIALKDWVAQQTDEQTDERYVVHGLKGKRFHIVDLHGEHAPAKFGEFTSIVKAEHKAKELNEADRSPHYEHGDTMPCGKGHYIEPLSD